MGPVHRRNKAGGSRRDRRAAAACHVVLVLLGQPRRLLGREGRLIGRLGVQNLLPQGRLLLGVGQELVGQSLALGCQLQQQSVGLLPLFRQLGLLFRQPVPQGLLPQPVQGLLYLPGGGRRNPGPAGQRDAGPQQHRGGLCSGQMPKFPRAEQGKIVQNIQYSSFHE